MYQSDRLSESEWNELSHEEAAALDKYRSYPITDIAPQDFERNLYCLKCDLIRFQTQAGEKIVETKGSGAIILPRNVGVWIAGGKSRCIERD